MAKDKYSSGDGYMYVYLLSIVACVVVALVVALMVFGSGLFKKNDTSKPAGNDTSSEASKLPENDDTSDYHGAESEPSRFTQGSVDNSEVNNGLLVLVNSDNRYVFPEETDMVNLYTALKGSNVSQSGSGLYMNSTSAKALKAMCEAFYNETGLTGGVLVYSSYLSYEKALAAGGADAAGTSDYHTGNTVVLRAWPSTVGKMGEGQFEWFLDNCYSYGFVLRYPEGKDEITGVDADFADAKYRNGIFRYVGVCHAYYMYKNNLCLEEYLELIKQYTPEEPLIIDVQNKSYEVYYQPMEDGLTSTVSVPNDSAYLISGNNSDGFIITITG